MNMTLQDIINWFGNHPKLILNYFIGFIIVSLLGLLFFKPQHFKNPLKYFYSIIVYGVAIPGLLSVVLLIYGFFFLRLNLLNVDVLSYFTPIIGCIITLIIVNKTIPMRLIPGFKNLTGLFVMILITFFITYMIQKMFFGVIFIGSFIHLLLLFLGLLIILKLAWNRFVK